MKRAILLLALAVVPAATAGCGLGSADAGGSSDDSDKRAVAMTCLQDKGIDARLQGDSDIAIGDTADAPRIKFFLTAGESEAAAFEGRGEGAEQIGSALLYTRKGSDDLLKDVENCLAEL
jgi:hypothetical protein